MSQLLFATTYSRLLARELQLDGEAAAPLLAGTQISPQQLFQLDEYLSLPDQVTIIRNALRIAGRPGLGLVLGSRLSLAAHGTLGQLLAASPTLGDAWAALERFHALRVPLVTVRREVRAGHVYIRLDPECALDEVGLFLVETMVVTVQRGIELVIGHRLRDAELALGYPAPAHAADYATVLHSPYTFGGQRTRWRIPRHLMDQPNPFRDDKLYREAMRQCEQAAGAIAVGGKADWHTRVAGFLNAQPGVLWSLAEVAAHFHVSPRTLIRHLKAEGTAYQQLLDEAMAQRAMELLRDRTHTVESAALAIGYRDATAFRRAFKRWCGESPSAWLAREGVGRA